MGGKNVGYQRPYPDPRPTKLWQTSVRPRTSIVVHRKLAMCLFTFYCTNMKKTILIIPRNVTGIGYVNSQEEDGTIHLLVCWTEKNQHRVILFKPFRTKLFFDRFKFFKKKYYKTLPDQKRYEIEQDGYTCFINIMAKYPIVFRKLDRLLNNILFTQRDEYQGFPKNTN